MNQNLPKLILVGVGIAAVIMAIVLALKPATTTRVSAIPVVEPEPPPQQLPSQIEQLEPILVEAPEDMGDSDSDSDSETMAVYVHPSKVEEPCKQIIINDNACISKAKATHKEAYKNCNPESTISDSADIDASSNVNRHTSFCTTSADKKKATALARCNVIEVHHSADYECPAK